LSRSPQASVGHVRRSVIVLLRFDVVPTLPSMGPTSGAEQFCSSARKDFFDSIGQSEKSGRATGKSALPSTVLQKSFCIDEQEFLEPLMRFARSDMRDHIVSRKNDHAALYRRGGVCRDGVGKKSASARFSTSFDFRLLQHYPLNNGHRQPSPSGPFGARFGRE